MAVDETELMVVAVDQPVGIAQLYHNRPAVVYAVCRGVCISWSGDRTYGAGWNIGYGYGCNLYQVSALESVKLKHIPSML